MYARDLSRHYAITFVVLTSCYTVAIYVETSLLLYDGFYFWAVTKLGLCCLFFARFFLTKNKQPRCQGILADLGLGPLTMYGVDKKTRSKTLYFSPSPQKRRPHRRESASPFQLDARTPLLPTASPESKSSARYRPNRMVTFDSTLGSNSEHEANSPRETVVQLTVKELFDKDGDVARAIHRYVLFYIGPQLVLNIARYQYLVAEHDMVWVGFGLKSPGLSPSMFWITSFIAIITFPFYYVILEMAHRRTQAFERLNRIAMDVEVEEDEEKKTFDRISDSAVLPATEPARDAISLTIEKLLDREREIKEPVAHSLPNRIAGGVLTKRSAFNDFSRPVGGSRVTPKFGNVN